jgi:hypothetical protein
MYEVDTTVSTERQRDRALAPPHATEVKHAAGRVDGELENDCY